MSSFKKGAGNSEIERKIQKGKSWEENPKATSYENGGFTTKEKVSSNLPTSSVNSKRFATCVLRHSTRSFGNKALVALN